MVTIKFPPWQEFEIKKLKNKGKAVFVRDRLCRLSCIPYFGRIQHHIDISDNPFLVEINSKCFIDGTPITSKDKEICLASYINEPSTGEIANCRLVTLRGGDFPCAFIVTTRDIEKGEELTFKYGPAYRRNGYRAGRAAPKPKKGEPKQFIGISRITDEDQRKLHFWFARVSKIPLTRK